MKKTSSVLSILLALLMLFSVTSVAAGGALTLESATIGDTPIAEATTIRTNDEILLTFSGKVTDSSVLAFNVGKISVRDSGGTAMSSVTVSSAGGKKFLVSLGGIEKGSYTLTIGKEFKDIDGNTLGTKVEIPFTVNKGDGTGSGGGNNPLSFVSAKAGDADLANAALEATGTITITFDRGMTKYQADNFAQIGIYDADGAKVDGVTFTDFVKDADDNSYTVLSYSDLPAGAYTLKLGKDLKANNDNTLGEDVTITFTVKGAEADNTNSFTAFIKTIVDFFKMIVNFFKNLFK